MSKLLALGALTITLAAGRAAAAESPPYAGTHDDTAYPSDVQRASFSPDAERDGPFMAGSPSDDTTYPIPRDSSPAVTTHPTETRVACACCR